MRKKFYVEFATNKNEPAEVHSLSLDWKDNKGSFGNIIICSNHGKIELYSEESKDLIKEILNQLVDDGKIVK